MYRFICHNVSDCESPGLVFHSLYVYGRIYLPDVSHTDTCDLIFLEHIRSDDIRGNYVRF